MKGRLTLIVIFAIINTLATAQITPWEAVNEIKKGVNLGNTLEPPYEGGWNNPKPQENYFNYYKKAGFDLVRIPVRWDNYTEKTSPYKIDSGWLERVSQIVDWGLSRGLYVVINSHHDNWIKENYTEQAQRERFDSIWSQVSVYFKNKSEKLFFEILNEPNGLSKIQNDELHKRILSIIRKTNPTRIVIFQGNEWGGSDVLLKAAIPDDDYVIGSFHSYDPYLFGLEGEGNWGSNDDINELREKFSTVKHWSDTSNVPVFMGEYGAIKTCDYNSRMKHYKYYAHFASEYNFIPCVWEDGGDFRILNRATGQWDEIKDIAIYCSEKSPDNLKLKVYQDSIIKLSWKNIIKNNDSIFIQRRKSNQQQYTNIATISQNASTYYDIKPDTNLTYHYRVIAHYNDSTDIYSYPQRIYFPGWVIAKQEVFLDSPAKIPGTVEAENYDKGGEGVAYHDMDTNNKGGAYRKTEGVDIFETNGNFLILNAEPGEWYEYTVDVAMERSYNIEINIASPQNGGKFVLQIGETKSDTLEVISSGSWLNTTSIKTSMWLKQGQQVLRFTIVSVPAFNIDNMVFSIDTHSEVYKSPPDIFNILYPQNQGEVIIQLNSSCLRQVDIFNISGTKITSTEITPGEKNIHYKNMKPGVYIIRAYSGTNKFVRKALISN